MPNIHCSVSNCHYWGSGNMCNASEIMVTSDRIGANMPNSYDAPQASTAQPTPVNSAMETCCKTFVPKNSADVKNDGVQRR
mgnify:CR=1 FL=1